MKHLNFLSKSSSQSCGHSSVTLASTVGSPSAHRRGIMLKLLSVLVLIFTLGVTQMWGTTTAAVGDILWQESFTGGSSSTTFSATSSWSTGTGTSMLNSSDKSDISYSTSNAMLSTASSGGVTGSHVWLNKQTTGYFQVDGIPVYNATKVQFSLAKNSKVQLTITYKRSSDTSWQSGGTISASNTSGSSSEITVTPNSTISIKIQRASNKDASRIDNLTLTVKEIQQVVTCNTDPTVGDIMNDVSSITASGATFTTSAGVSAGSNCTLSEVGFVYGTSNNPTTTTGTKVVIDIDNYSSGDLSKTVTGLDDNTTYYVRAFATNGHGTTYSDQKSFTTLELAKYTVQFSTGEGNPTRNDLTEASAGAGITLPTAVVPHCSGWTFAGWSETNVSSETTTAPTLLDAETTYHPATNCTLYAVYSRSESGDPVPAKLSASYSSSTGWTASGCGGSSYWILKSGASITSPVISDLSTVTSITFSARTYGGADYKTINAKTSGNVNVGSTDAASATMSSGYSISVSGLTGSGSLVLSSSTTSSANGPGINNIEINYTTTPSTTYYLSAPDCCTELAQINGSINLSHF